MRLCTYQNNGLKCKNWVANDEEENCPFHKGVLIRDDKPVSESERRYKERFEHHLSLADQMTNEQLRDHILQLDQLMEDMKIRQQAAAHSRTKRAKALLGKGELTEEQKAELEIMRDPRMRVSKKDPLTEKAPALSKEEKEIQRFMSKNPGFTREKVIRLLGLDE